MRSLWPGHAPDTNLGFSTPCSDQACGWSGGDRSWEGPSYLTSAWGPLRIRLSWRQMVGVVLAAPMEAGDRLANFVRNLLEFFQGEEASLKT